MAAITSAFRNITNTLLEGRWPDIINVYLSYGAHNFLHTHSHRNSDLADMITQISHESADIAATRSALTESRVGTDWSKETNYIAMLNGP